VYGKDLYCHPQASNMRHAISDVYTGDIAATHFTLVNITQKDIKIVEIWSPGSL